MAMEVVKAKKQPQFAEYDVGDNDDLYTTRSHSSARRYRQPIEHDTRDDPLLQSGVIQRRRSNPLVNAKGSPSKALIAPSAPIVEVEHKQRHFPLMAILIGMVVMALLAVALSSFASWWHIHL